jgi:signal transduction histidine kinase
MSLETSAPRRPALSFLAWTLAILAVAGLLAAAVFNLYRPGPGGVVDSIWFLAWVGFPIVGAVLASRLPYNRLAWLLVATGSGIGLGVGATGAVILAIEEGIDSAWVDWFALAPNPLIGLGFLAVPFILLLFPDDRLSPGWSRVAGVGVVVGAAAVISILLTPVVDLDGRVEIGNPLPFAQGPVGEVAEMALFPLGLTMVAIAVAALARAIVRYRRSTGVERLQRKWVVFAASLFPPIWLTGVALSYSDEFWGQLVVYLAFVIALDGIAVAIAIAVLKHRLYDIDLVINKTLVFGSLAVFIGVVYVGIVVGVGALVGSGSEEPSLLLSIVATSVVAVGFQPARRRLQRIANRIVFGERATPYEVLAGFSHQATGGGDTFAEVSRLLVEGTAAEWAVITREGADTPLAVWPDEIVPSDDGVSRVITHEDEVMGELRFGVAAGESLTSQQSEVVDHLITALGLLLANTRLTVQLRNQVGELEQSRSRIVAAGDEVRRRIETQLEEGPLATLHQITTGLETLEVAASNGGKTDTTLQSVAEVVEAAKQAVSEFARGVFPPILVEQGLEGALQQRAETAPIPVTVESNLDRRYPLEVEAAIYFTASEALQNTIKYANATRAEVRLTEEDGVLTLQVSDNGDGFDPDTVTTGSGITNITERITALDGQLQVDSAPGEGTTLKASIPVSTALAATPL